MKKSKLPKKQWKIPAEQELFDHLPSKLEYNFEGLSEEKQRENFKDCYMQAMAVYFTRHPVDGYFKNETYGMMFSRDEHYAKELGQALTAVVEPYVEGKSPSAPFRTIRSITSPGLSKRTVTTTRTAVPRRERCISALIPFP